MSYELCLSEYKPNIGIITGDWKLMDGKEWNRFVYFKSSETSLTYNGCYYVETGCFFEYNIELTYDQGKIRGGGENRFGKFTIESTSLLRWKKTYTKMWPRVRCGKVDVGVNRTRLQISRILRVVFKDKLWKLENEVKIGKKNLIDVRFELLRTETEDDIRLFNHKILLLDRRSVEIAKRGQYERDVRVVENKINRLQLNIRHEMTKLGYVTYQITPQMKLKLAKKVTREKLNQVLENHEKPTFGIKLQEEPVDVTDVNWEEITDELYLELKE